jgi:hypothetical protein
MMLVISFIYISRNSFDATLSREEAYIALVDIHLKLQLLLEPHLGYQETRLRYAKFIV